MTPADGVSIYQSTDVPVSFSAVVVFTGPSIPPWDSQPNLGFHFYFSDGHSLKPSVLLNGGSELLVEVDNSLALDPDSDNALKGALVNGQSYSVDGSVEIMVSPVYCGSDRYLCIEYIVLRTMTPAFRDMDDGNNFGCVDVSALLACHDGRLQYLI